jgi:hypothetical protein
MVRPADFQGPPERRECYSARTGQTTCWLKKVSRPGFDHDTLLRFSAVSRAVRGGENPGARGRAAILGFLRPPPAVNWVQNPSENLLAAAPVSSALPEFERFGQETGTAIEVWSSLPLSARYARLWSA